MRRHLRLFLVGGGGILVVIGLIAGFTLVRANLPREQASSVNGSVRAIPDLASLVHQSDLVVVGQVVGGSSSPSRGGSATALAVVSVEAVVRGPATAGQQLSVVQDQPEEGPPMQTGQRYVLFLIQAEPGTYYTAGGAQGRLLVDATDIVHPVNPGSPATHAYNGQSLASFSAAVAAIRG